MNAFDFGGTSSMDPEERQQLEESHQAEISALRERMEKDILDLKTQLQSLTEYNS